MKMEVLPRFLLLGNLICDGKAEISVGKPAGIHAYRASHKTDIRWRGGSGSFCKIEYLWRHLINILSPEFVFRIDRKRGYR